MKRKSGGWRRALRRWLLIAATTYVAVCAVAAWQKEAIIFPVRGHARAMGRTAPAGYETWWLTLPDGARVEAWWRPFPGASPERPAPAVLVFHGNGELIDDSREFAEVWNAAGASVLLVEYRGYGRSGGEPGVATGIADAAAWFDRVAATPGVRPDVVLAYGFSLGGVFAAELAAIRPVAGLAMEGAPSGLVEIARDRGIWLVFTRERFDGRAALASLAPDVPVLLTHGRPDLIVPFRHLGLLSEARPGATVVAGTHPHEPYAAWMRPALLQDLLASAVARADRRADKTLASAAPASAR